MDEVRNPYPEPAEQPSRQGQSTMLWAVLSLDVISFLIFGSVILDQLKQASPQIVRFDLPPSIELSHTGD